MSEISEQELKLAAERCLNGGDESWSCSSDYYKSTQHANDNDIVAKFVIDELARREAERAELDQSIDAEWCVANGAVQLGQHFVFWRITDSHAVNVYLRPSDQCVAYGQCAMPSIATRRQLLDLLRALKGGAT